MFLERLIKGHFPKAHKAAAEGPKALMALLDTVPLPFGHTIVPLFGHFVVVMSMCNRRR
jgi:hypothetical protein